MRGINTTRVAYSVALGLFVVLTIGGYLALRSDSLVGSPRPDLPLTSLSGIPTRLPVPYLRKHVLLLFTPSCSHCRTELHQLSQLSRHFPSLAFYAVSLGTSDETMRLIAGIDNGIPVFLDRDQFARHWFSVRRVPLLLFVDESDVIRRALTGARPVQEDSVLLSRFSRPGTPGASGVGRVEEMDARMFPERPRRQ